MFAPNSNLRAQVTASQRLLHSEIENSPVLAKKGNEASEKPYHARAMSSLAGTAQRLKRVFNIDITECEKCQQHNVSVIACIIDSHVIQKILEHLDKKYPTSSQTTLLPPLRAPPDEQRDFNFGA